jgi:acetoin utilization deacetylase AcuC-like enzyme
VLLFGIHEAFSLHDTGPHHPERPSRLAAVRAGIDRAELTEALVPFTPREATAEEITRVHSAAYVEALDRLCADGGGRVDADTTVSAESCRAARLAAGTGLEAVRLLDQGRADAAFCAVRPPGHHALPRRGMGFCLYNNIGVVATHLADRGEQVAILDIDAHHGNGTQDLFWDDPRVLFVSTHQWPLYPGTGAPDETGGPHAPGLTLNLPFPPGTTGDVYLQAFDEVIGPAVEAFAPTWVLVSAGFDAHRADPLTDLGLSAGDYGDVMARIETLVPQPGRLILFLEGGYDLEAIAASVGTSLAVLVGGGFRPEAATSGGPGAAVVERARALRPTSG